VIVNNSPVASTCSSVVAFGIMKSVMKAAVHRTLAALGYRLERLNGAYPTYDSDGLTVFQKHAPFLDDPRFRSAYRSAIEREPHLRIEWRVAVTCWAARHGSRLPGDFVECGVNNGMHSRAICEYLDFNAIDKCFYLFDTFCGIPDEQRSPRERSYGHSHAGYYEECFEQTKKTFEQFPRVALIRGKVPDTLSSVNIDRVAYLSIDMNITYPERKAIEHFWPKLSTGAIVVLDDYGWFGYEEQRDSMDEFARGIGTEVLSLPTGQGLLIKS
jgi:hypothetical protein